MRSINLAFLVVFMGHGLIAGDTETNTESSTYKHQIRQLKASLSTSAQDPIRIKVLAELRKWDPEKSNEFWQPLMYLKDSYLFDPGVNGTIRAMYLPSFINFFYEQLVGSPVTFPLDSIVRTQEIGLEALRQIHRLPYMISVNSDGEISSGDLLSWPEAGKSCAITLSHLSAMGSQACQTMVYKSNDAISIMGAYLATCGLQGASYLFAAAAGYLSADDDYIDVILRSLKRNYELGHLDKELGVVLEMIAYRAQIKAKKD